MAGVFHIYFEAAQALWDMSTGHLETMARSATSAGERRAAALALDLKRDLVTPGEFRQDERGSLTKLASSLLEDRQFTMEMALKMAPKNARRSATAIVQSGVGHRRPRHTVMWVAISAGVILLVMDMLATAGVPVPTPIGDTLDRVTGEDESPVVVPAPQLPRPREERRDAGTVLGEGTEEVLAVGSGSERERSVNRDDTPTETRPGETDDAGAATPGPATPARGGGKEAHQAQGKESHQAQGKEAHQAQGRVEHQPTTRGHERAGNASPRGKAKGPDKGSAS